MRVQTLTTILALVAIGSLFAVVALSAAGDPPSPGVGAAPLAGGSDKPGDDAVIGDYVGTFHLTATRAGKNKPKDAPDYKEQKCGACHIDATVRRAGDGYQLTLDVRIGKDKEGKLKTRRLVALKSQRQGDALLFVNDDYTLTAGKDTLQGGRTGKIVVAVDLKRKTAETGKRASAPARPETKEDSGDYSGKP